VNIKKKVIVIVPAYNVEKTIHKVFQRIPKSFLPNIAEFIVINDGSIDNTVKVIQKMKSEYRITLINKEQNEGYARAQKTGFKLALDNNAEISILLHSDGQYSPEVMPILAEPLLKKRFDIVMGSRMMKPGEALKGGMPLYKFVANILLSKLENLCYGLNHTEYHSGYMLYSRKALQNIPFEKLSDTFHFDGEMLLVASMLNLRIHEIPIPTKYGDEKSYLRPIEYGFDVLKIMLKYKLGGYNFIISKK
jgi:glycosyltransferase involved in cell wall biosynthesis|tara:strand:- start:467 stop:1213 length:747 start_codon:yes stop_codon:yes gene_type:complete